MQGMKWECEESGWKCKKMWGIRVAMPGIKMETLGMINSKSEEKSK